MRRLTDSLGSAYVEAANRLKPKAARKRVVAYVESYDDVAFWRTVLGDLETDSVYFEVMLPSRTTLGKGKKNALANDLGPQLGDYMIACVDADYDWLLGAPSLRNPHVFHTYVYAIESYQCYARGLHEACATATLNDREPFSLEAFVTEYSRAVWPLFVWSVWAYRHDGWRDFSLMDFCNVVTFHDISPHHPEQALAQVRRAANRYVAVMQKRHPNAKGTYLPLRDELRQMGVTPDTCYMYMQGHRLMDGVVLPLVEPICAMLRKERETEIRNLACHDTQRQNELSCYRRSQLPVAAALKKGQAYKHSQPYRQLRQDLQEFVDKL